MSGVGVHGSESRPFASTDRGMGKKGRIGSAAAGGMARYGWFSAGATKHIAEGWF